MYVGQKPFARDNVARSGVTWNGPGDIQNVTDAQAKMLLKFADQWELADEQDRKTVETPVSITVTDEDGDEVIIDPESFNQPVERMNKAELKAYAKSLWGQDLDARKSTKAMIDQIEEWQRDLPQLNEMR